MIVFLASSLGQSHNFVFALEDQGSVVAGAFVPEAISTVNLSVNDGGSHTFTNDDSSSVVFTFPEDFYSEDLDFQAISYPATSFIIDKPAPAGDSFIGKVYDFIFRTSDGTDVTTLSIAPTIVLHYFDSDVTGFNEGLILPYRRNSADTSWNLISGSTVDTDSNTITFSTTTFSTFAIFGAPSCSDNVDNDSDGKIDYPADPGCTSTTDNTEEDAVPAAPGGGGGSGSGGFTPAPVTQVIFSGRAYPGSSVTLLKDAQIIATVNADTSANFQIGLSSLSGGNYIFSVYSVDKKGLRSSLLTFSISLTAGATTKIDNIFIAPTIAVDKDTVKKGDNIAILGQSVPSADIIISVNSEEEFFVRTISDANGVYLYNFDTTVLEYGDHYTKSKASAGNIAISSFSRSINFKVGTTNISNEFSNTQLIGDVNGDLRVNLIDFSIVAFWYKRSSPPIKVDFNNDGKVNLIDFSIMAFHWTG